MNCELTFCVHAVYTQCMPNRRVLSEDRDFLSLVTAAAFANPFGPERDRLDRLILGGRSDGTWRQIVPDVVREVSTRLARLDEPEPARLDDFTARDRRLMRYVFLFDVFHRVNLEFDDFIERQAAAGPEPLTVPFAGRASESLTHRGFAPDEAWRYFSFFYQIRRAFHFIDRGLVGQSPCMQRLRMDLWNNIFTHHVDLFEQVLWDRMEDFSTLLLGPTGSGKGTAAAAIGRSGFIPYDPKRGRFARSFTEAFVSINLSQFPETLLESELFGHAKGAFTGAVTSRQGLLSLCGRHGAVFLDEIGEISPATQVKLLQVLEERTFRPVGSHESCRFHGRVIAATNRDLEHLRRSGTFREDFYYRLCSDCIRVPGLRQRLDENPAELEELITHVVRWITGRPWPELVGLVREVIEHRLGPDYPWPGNVRELAQCVRRVILRRDYEGDQPGPSDPLARLTDDLAAGALSAEDLLSGYCRLLYDRFGTYQEVARRTGLDRRTVRRHIHGPGR